MRARADGSFFFEGGGEGQRQQAKGAEIPTLSDKQIVLQRGESNTVLRGKTARLYFTG